MELPLQHEPAWRDALIKEGARHKEQNLVHSHLYKTGGTLVGTFQRIDIPILRQFDQYNYVLFTGAQLVGARGHGAAVTLCSCSYERGMLL